MSRLPALIAAAAACIAVLLAAGCGTGSHEQRRDPSHSSTPVRSGGSGHGDQTGSVPCPLTHAAGADGANSCWATHTGVQGATGYTEEQIENGTAPGFTHVAENLSITQAGTTIDHQWISGCVAVKANNVTIKNSLITPPDGDACAGGSEDTQPAAINTGQGAGTPTGTLVQDTTVDGGNATGNQFGVSIDEGSCIRCDVFGFAKSFVTGVNTAAHRAVFQDDYSHDISVNSCAGYRHGCTTPQGGASSACAHDDGWYMDSATYVTIEHSYSILTGAEYCATGAISVLGSYGPAHDITVNHSYAEGVKGGDLYLGRPGACASPNIIITNNALSSDSGYGGTNFVSFWTPVENTWNGNYTAESGARIPAPGASSGC